MEALFDRVLDRTRSRLDVPAIRTLFGLKARPHRNRKAGPPAQEIVIEKPRYGLSWFRISFGRLQLKAYTKGEHVLRFEATVHNPKELCCRRSLESFAEIITLLAGMADRFATALDCADTGFLPDGVLDELPLPSPSPRWSPCAITSSPRSSPGSAAPAWAANRKSGPPPTVITRPCASACRPCSGTSASRRSQQPHRQHFVDQRMQAPGSVAVAGPRTNASSKASTIAWVSS
jgi:hypothetical protein